MPKIPEDMEALRKRTVKDKLAKAARKREDRDRQTALRRVQKALRERLNDFN
jgi:hypothetical protein